MDPIKIACIGDIHIGKLDVHWQWENLEKGFLTYCRKNNPNVIAICGDIMDTKVAVNSTAALYFHKFIDECIKTGATVLVVEGTASHDASQIQLFSSEISEKFRIFNTVTTETIHGLKCLMIPEEHVPNPRKYYENYLVNDYDLVLGHGLFSHVNFSTKQSKFKKITCPVFDYDRDFKRKVGTIVFGHIHTPSHTPDERMWYVGSYARLNHGEEEDKGFLELIYDGKKWTRTFIKNEGALKFVTVCESTLPSDRDSLMTELNNLVNSVYKLRIRLDRQIDDLRLSDIVSFAKTNYSVSIDKYYNRKAKKNDVEDEIVLVENKYESMDIVDAIAEFVLENNNVHLDKSFIRTNISSSE